MWKLRWLAVSLAVVVLAGCGTDVTGPATEMVGQTSDQSAKGEIKAFMAKVGCVPRHGRDSSGTVGVKIDERIERFDCGRASRPAVSGAIKKHRIAKLAGGANATVECPPEIECVDVIMYWSCDQWEIEHYNGTGWEYYLITDNCKYWFAIQPPNGGGSGGGGNPGNISYPAADSCPASKDTLGGKPLPMHSSNIQELFRGLSSTAVSVRLESIVLIYQLPDNSFYVRHPPYAASNCSVTTTEPNGIQYYEPINGGVLAGQAHPHAYRPDTTVHCTGVSQRRTTERISDVDYTNAAALSAALGHPIPSYVIDTDSVYRITGNETAQEKAARPHAWALGTTGCSAKKQ